MKAIHAALLATITTASFVPFASGADASGCDVRTLAAQALPGGYYVSSVRREVWQEDNALPGLQIRATGCADGRLIPADQCLASDPFTGANQQALCALAAASETLP